jgi:signal transduction histidine kinase
MRLADFIEHNAAAIADAAEAFAATQASPGVHMDSAALRDHIPDILEAVVLDLRTAQNDAQALAKSEGRGAIPGGPKSAAMSHGRLRAKDGFNVDQMVAEYRAMRASVLRLWVAQKTLEVPDVDDLIRFNEAIDQAVAESVADFSAEAESWRQVFLGVLGHDLRGPLSVIVMTSEVMALMTRDTPFSEQTDRIIRSGRRMSALLDDLLDYSRTSLGMGIRVVRTESDLEEALNEEIDLLRIALPGVAITFDANGPIDGAFDASRIREALGNLVTNAAKYGAAGGDIRVTLSGTPEHVDLMVRNEGPTLTPAALKSLFDPLKRGTHQATMGEETSLGLGLFIVREIAKAHGGELTADSSQRSTAFKMRLPKQSTRSQDTGSEPSR